MGIPTRLPIAELAVGDVFNSRDDFISAVRPLLTSDGTDTRIKVDFDGDDDIQIHCAGYSSGNLSASICLCHASACRSSHSPGAVQITQFSPAHSEACEAYHLRSVEAQGCDSEIGKGSFKVPGSASPMVVEDFVGSLAHPLPESSSCAANNSETSMGESTYSKPPAYDQLSLRDTGALTGTYNVSESSRSTTAGPESKPSRWKSPTSLLSRQTRNGSHVESTAHQRRVPDSSLNRYPVEKPSYIVIIGGIIDSIARGLS